MTTTKSQPRMPGSLLRRWGMIVCAAAGLSLVGAWDASAAPVVLSDAENQAYFNIHGDAGKPAGLYDLTRPQYIAGDPNPPLLHDMTQQWFWYRVGNGPEQALSHTQLQSHSTYDTNLSGSPDRLELQYAGPGFSAFITYSLTGSGPGEHQTTLNRSVLLLNTTATPLTMSWFDYNNLFLTAADRPDAQVNKFPDYGEFLNSSGNTVRQFDNDGPHDYSPLNSEAQIIFTPVPSSYELGLTSDPNSILDRLNDGLPTTLDPTGAMDLIGPGDVNFALQWNITIPAFGAFIIGADMLIVPEPASAMLLAAGGILLLLPRRPRHRSR